MSRTSPASQLARSGDIATKVALVFRKRVEIARETLTHRLEQAREESGVVASATPADAARLWSDAFAYAVDASQRTVLFWDTLRKRGNAFLEHAQSGLPPVLHFEYEMVVDGRTLPRAVNYALVRILPPPDVVVDPSRRPYVIIDPRAGHGPGIGGFKDDSQVGVALRGGHPVYFVIFFRDPQPGQTLLDVCGAEKIFVRKVRELHPESPKPAIVGNCQGGWAAMMLAASGPDDTGPIVINGAPMSYWGGAWQEGAGDNPMRYAGGMLGGTWLASLSADLGDGVFDGAYLVENFENLNPANTFWDKYYHLYANIDTEPPRFLEFERWWGGFYLMNREEIEWITRNLFVGNTLWKGATPGPNGEVFDLREIKAPIVLFASMGDNITPPQQAFNWVADVYGSTDEIKARGQVIVGLLHEDVGHLGIFVSGKVAKKEHAQIVSVLESIETLPPGLYAMRITERKGRGGKPEYDVEFEERRLEDVVARLNRFQRADERPFEALAAVSEFNQRAYELFLQPLVQSVTNESTAKLGRTLHPLRMQRWAWSDLNPWLQWLAPAADAVRGQRTAAGADNVYVRLEKAASSAISASLDSYRAVRDAASEAAFFLTYGNVFSLYVADRNLAAAQAMAEPRDLPFVQEALASLSEGGYAEALARVACLLARRGEPVLLSRLSVRQQLLGEYRDLLPDMPPDQWRRIRGEQDIIVRYAPDEALATLPRLLRDERDRARLVTLVRRLLDDPRVHRTEATEDQRAMVDEIGLALMAPLPPAATGERRAPKRKPGTASAPAAGAAGARTRKTTPHERPRPRGVPDFETMERTHEKYQRLLDFCKTLSPVSTAVAHPCDETSLRGAVDAARMGLILPLIVGPKARIEAIAREHGIDIAGVPLIDAPYSEASAAKAVDLVREGRAEALMKGSLHTDELMAAVVRSDTGLRTARRISHCFVMDVPSYSETLIVTDAAINIAPTLEDKVHIVQNAIDLARAMRFDEVRVAILSAMETVNPKVPSTVEAAALCKMADRGQITGGILDGPLALDNAISLESVKIKHIDSPVAGRANVLVVPDLEAGNMLAKSLSFMAGADAAGIVLGARVPIVLTSRADSVTTRLASCGIASLVAHARREAAPKAIA